VIVAAGEPGSLLRFAASRAPGLREGNDADERLLFRYGVIVCLFFLASLLYTIGFIGESRSADLRACPPSTPSVAFRNGIGASCADWNICLEIV